MEFKKLCEEHNRMCKNYSINHNEKNCPLRPIVAYCSYCQFACMKNPEISEKIISDWVELHPRKTMLDVVLEKFPNIRMLDCGSPVTCPGNMEPSWKADSVHGCIFNADGSPDCYNCWRRPVPEE